MVKASAVGAVHSRFNIELVEAQTRKSVHSFPAGHFELKKQKCAVEWDHFIFSELAISNCLNMQC